MFSKKINVFIFLFLLLVVEIIVYYLIYQTIPNADTSLAAREIETIYKLILNGYLGALFGFKYSGNINWIIVPFLIIYFYEFRNDLLNIIKNQKVVLVAFIFTFILISLKGFFNPRYQYTITIILTITLFYLLWKLFYTKQRYFFNLIVVFLLLVSGINFGLQTIGPRFKEKFNKIFNFSNQKKQIDQNFNDKELIFDNLLLVIDTMNVSEYFLVNNLPDFYYYTNKKGHYYWCGNDEFYSSRGIQSLFDTDNYEQIKSRLINELNCRYIYTYKLYFNYNSRFDQFIKKYTSLIYTDRDNRMLYKIIE